MTEGYYDPTDPEDPIKYKLNKNNFVPITYGGYAEKTYKLKENVVKTIEGNEEAFVSLLYDDSNYFGVVTKYPAI